MMQYLNLQKAGNCQSSHDISLKDFGGGQVVSFEVYILKKGKRKADGKDLLALEVHEGALFVPFSYDRRSA